MTLPFPFRITYKRKVRFNRFNDEQIRFLKRNLETKSLVITSYSDKLVDFKVPFSRFTWSWDIWKPVDKGQFRIQKNKDKNEIVFEVSYTRMILIYISLILGASFIFQEISWFFIVIGGLSLLIGWIRQELYFIDLVDDIKLVITKVKKHNNAF